MDQDFLLEILHINEQLEGEGHVVHSVYMCTTASEGIHVSLDNLIHIIRSVKKMMPL
jgi:hypothetical protein